MIAPERKEDRQILKELAETLRFDYLNEKAAIARLACAFLNETAHNDVSFSASCDLMNCGPKNDWNGIRSSAERVRSEWEDRIMNPALCLYRNLKERKEMKTNWPKEEEIKQVMAEQLSAGMRIPTASGPQTIQHLDHLLGKYMITLENKVVIWAMPRATVAIYSNDYLEIK